MELFVIYNATSTHIFGEYSGYTGADAIARMIADAGSSEDPSEDIVAVPVVEFAEADPCAQYDGKTW